MPDSATELLFVCCDLRSGPSLWLAGESSPEALPRPSTTPIELLCITNRYDVASSLTKHGYDVAFNDFALEDLAANSFEQILFRVSKEKALCHFVINESFRLLRPGGQLLISGGKNEGIKTYLKKAALLYGPAVRQAKAKPAVQLGAFKRQAPAGEYLRDQAYRELLPISSPQFGTYLSKPGVFGWNKFDRGSVLLLRHLPELVTTLPPKERVLDLGCGYGLLGIETCKQLAVRQLVLTDNNAAALAATTCNVDQHLPSDDIQCDIVAADVGDSLQGHFDLIVCNPPFHQGFSTSKDLGIRFCARTAQLLAPQGLAIFVVNEFIPLERYASGLFRQVDSPIKDAGFKLVTLAKPRAG